MTTTMRPQSALISDDTRNLAPPTRPFERSRRQSSFNSLLSSVPEDSDSLSISASSLKSSYKVRPAEQTEPGDWTLDVGAVDAKRTEWKLRERVILVLGEYTPSALQPILTDPLFSNTLVILGSMRPKQPIPTSSSGARLYHLPPPKWAHCTIQEVVERAIPIATAFRKKQSSRRGMSFFSRPKAKVDANVIDCVINILSPTLRFDPRQAMPKLLREVVMSTTAVMASVPREKGLAAMPLVQVLPTSYPPALPSVVERYLASLQQLPSSSSGGIRPIALGQPTFLQGKLTTSSDFTPIEAILYDALSWSATYESANSAKRRSVYLPGWSAVTIASSRASPPMLSPSASFQPTLMDRRGSAASTASRSSMFSTTEDGPGPITPSGSSESLPSDRIAPLSPVMGQSSLSVPEQKSALQVPYASLRSLPVQRSRLSHVQTADEDRADSPADTTSKRASSVTARAAPASTEADEHGLLGREHVDGTPGKQKSAPVESVRKKGSLGWLRRGSAAR